MKGIHVFFCVEIFTSIFMKIVLLHQLDAMPPDPELIFDAIPADPEVIIDSIQIAEEMKLLAAAIKETGVGNSDNGNKSGGKHTCEWKPGASELKKGKKRSDGNDNGLYSNIKFNFDKGLDTIVDAFSNLWWDDTGSEEECLDETEPSEGESSKPKGEDTTKLPSTDHVIHQIQQSFDNIEEDPNAPVDILDQMDISVIIKNEDALIDALASENVDEIVEAASKLEDKLNNATLQSEAIESIAAAEEIKIVDEMERIEGEIDELNGPSVPGPPDTDDMDGLNPVENLLNTIDEDLIIKHENEILDALLTGNTAVLANLLKDVAKEFVDAQNELGAAEAIEVLKEVNLVDSLEEDIEAQLSNQNPKPENTTIEEQVAEDVQKIKEDIKEVEETIATGDKDKIEEAIEKEKEDITDVADILANELEKDDKVLQAVEQVKDDVKKVEETIVTGDKDKIDESIQKEKDDLAAVEELLELSGNENEIQEQIREEVKQIEDDLKKVEETVATGDADKIDDAIQKEKEHIADVVDTLKNEIEEEKIVPEAVQQIEDDLKKLEETVATGDPVKIDEAIEKEKEDIAVVADMVGLPANETGKDEQIREEVEKIEEDMKQIEETVANGDKDEIEEAIQKDKDDIADIADIMVNKLENDEKVLEAVEQVKDDVKQLGETIATGDQEKIEEAIQKEKDDIAVVEDLLGLPGQEGKLEEEVREEVDQMIEDLKQVEDALATGDQEKIEEAIKKEMDDINDVVDILANEIEKDEKVLEAVSQVEEDIKKVEETVATGDPVKIEEVIKKEKEDIAALTDVLGLPGNKVEKDEQIREEAEKIEEDIDKIEETVAKGDKDGIDEAIQKEKEDIADIGDVQLNKIEKDEELLGAVEQVKDDGKKLEEAIPTGDEEKIEEAIQKEKDDIAVVEDILGPPGHEGKIEEGVREEVGQIKEDVKQVEEALETGNQEKIDEAIEKEKDDIADVEDILANEIEEDEKVLEAVVQLEGDVKNVEETVATGDEDKIDEAVEKEKEDIAVVEDLLGLPEHQGIGSEKPLASAEKNLEIDISGIGCNCKGYACGCCFNFELTFIGFRKSGCMLVTYDPSRTFLDALLTYNDETVFHKSFSILDVLPSQGFGAKRYKPLSMNTDIIPYKKGNPINFCFLLTIPHPHIPMNICAEINDIYLNHKDLGLCVTLKFEVFKHTIVTHEFHCMNMTLESISEHNKRKSISEHNKRKSISEHNKRKRIHRKRNRTTGPRKMGF